MELPSLVHYNSIFLYTFVEVGNFIPRVDLINFV